MGLVEKRVDVRQERVADLHGGLRSRGDGRPAERLLRNGRKNIVVAIEGEEGGELHPAGADLGICVAVEAAVIVSIR